MKKCCILTSAWLKNVFPLNSHLLYSELKKPVKRRVLLQVHAWNKLYVLSLQCEAFRLSCWSAPAHFWEVQLVAHTGKALKHSGKATRPAAKSRETRGDAKSHLSFSPLRRLLVTLSVSHPSRGLERSSDSWHQPTSGMSLRGHLWNTETGVQDGWMVCVCVGASDFELYLINNGVSDCRA